MPPRIVSLVPVLDLTWSRLHANFSTPIGNARTSWSSRETLLVRVRDAEGREGHGEAAPLPGVSRESLEDVLVALEGLGSSIAPSELDLLKLPPSLRFALDVALRTLQASPESLAGQLVGPELQARIAPQFALQILLSEVSLERASQAREEGAFAFKVKLGRPSAADSECALLRHLRAMGRDVIIRADANMSELDETLVDALHEVGACYVEDPGPRTASLLRRAGVPIALDALVLEDADAALHEILHARATTLVLKPSLLGPVERTFMLAARARARGGNVVLSHAMESPLGLATLHQLAFAMSATSPRALTPQGLAPWPGFDTFVHARSGEALPMVHQSAGAHIHLPS